jgi:hypothetical protein
VRRARRAQIGMVVAGAVVIAAGFAVAIVEALKLPKGSIWVVVGGAVLLVGTIRRFTAGRR